MRKFLLFLLILLILAIGADVLARRTAEEQVATRLKKTFKLSSQPEVSMSGLPFIVDLFRGKIDRIEMTGDKVRSEDLTLDAVTVDMRGVRFSLGDVVEGSGRVVVRGGDGSANVTEEDINEALGEVGAPFTVSITADGVVATAAEVEAEGDVAIDGNALSVGGDGFPAVPLDLPSLGGSVSYDSIALADGRATLTFTVERMSLQA